MCGLLLRETSARRCTHPHETNDVIRRPADGRLAWEAQR